MKTVVIANNFLSDLTNNGKTMKFLLSNYKEDDICWIYTTPLPTDLEDGPPRILISSVGKPLAFDKGGNLRQKASNSAMGLKHRAKSLRLGLRQDSIFRSPVFFDMLKFGQYLYYKIRYKELLKSVLLQLKDSEIDRVVFVAGDFVLLHDLASDLSRTFSVPLNIYITDDYLLNYSPRGDVRFRKGVHNSILRKRFLKTFSIASNVQLVSEKMRKVYNSEFNINAGLSFNSGVRDLRKAASSYAGSTNSGFTIRYFGSLHSGRAAALKSFMRLVDLFNANNEKKILVEVYSDTAGFSGIDSFIRNRMINILEPVSGAAFERALVGSDALLLLESNDVASLKRTWLSFSTKVMEYLYAQKPIVAYGPTDNPSIGELVSNKAAIHVRSESDFHDLFDHKVLGELLQKSVLFREYLEASNTPL